MITCRDAAEQMTEWLEDALSTWESLRLQAHLAVCAACREVLRQLRLTVEAMRGVAPPAPPAARVAELGALFRDWRASPEPRDSG